jgi:Amt family ammonium transporter
MLFDMTKIDSGSTAWLLVSAALVMLMTPGLAFFYAGMVRAKHTLGMLVQNIVCLGIVSLVWVTVTYSIAFGGANSLWGGLHFAGLAHMNQVVPGYTGSLAQVIPPIVFVAFQLMFAVITPALITGATADRWKFGSFCAFVTLWSVVVYAPVAHWVFSPTGWLFKLGAEDFAGGTVVHMNAGAAALAVAIVLGRRFGYGTKGFDVRGHNVPYVVLGAALLWFGWFGFNAGSALAAGNLSGFAFVNTNTATAAAMLAWMLVERLRDGKPSALGMASGAVAGLVAITPACGYVSPMGSIAIGAIAGAVCALATSIKGKVRIDDALDVGAVHFVGGAVGALLIGFFGDAATGGANGLFYGGGLSLLGKQATAVGVVGAYSFVVSLVLALVLNKISPMRLPDHDQQHGMDLSLHGEQAYPVTGTAIPAGLLTAGHEHGPAVGNGALTGAAPTHSGGDV